MAGVSQIVTKGISLATKYADDAARAASTSSDDIARYVKACGKKSILECKPLQEKIDIKELNLPTEVEIPNEVDEDEIADYLSDNYGFLVNSFVYNEEDFE